MISPPFIILHTNLDIYYMLNNIYFNPRTQRSGCDVAILLADNAPFTSIHAPDDPDATENNGLVKPPKNLRLKLSVSNLPKRL